MIGKSKEFHVRFVFERTDEDKVADIISMTTMKSLTGKRILLVEDNKINIEVGKVLLEKKGIIVEVAQDGQEAMDKFQANGNGYYDEILMDIYMPVMDGIKATQAIRNLGTEYAKCVPIIAMTANAMVEDMKVAFNAGMNAYLTKPIIPNDLYNTIVQWIND